MNTEKEKASEKVKEMLHDQQTKIKAEIMRNKWKIKKLAEEQAILKRQLPELQYLIRNMD